MAFCRGAIPSLLVLAAGLQLSVCLLKSLRDGGSDVRQEEHVPLKDVLKNLPVMSTSKRATRDHDPVLTGDHTFNDGYPTARIHYSGGESSTVFFVLTYVRGSNGVTTRSNLYKTDDYGGNFTNINSRLDSDNTVVLSPTFYTSDFDEDFLLFAHATQSLVYYTLDNGVTFHTVDMSSENINPRSITNHPSQNGSMMALDSSNALRVTQNFGQTWTTVHDNVNSYQWADQKWDANTLMIYYSTFEPDNPDLTVNLFTSVLPYTTHEQFDPDFGTHDSFLMLGPYIFAQRTDNGSVNLYVSHIRKPFKLARIPSLVNPQNYVVSNIDELRAMVVIEHEGGFYNLYVSDTTGVYYTLSLRDLVVERGSNRMDIKKINGVNGTLIANQYVRDDPSQQNAPVHTLISFDNGGFWELIVPPSYDVNGDPLNCEPPLCSLHLHMDTTSYARLGVFATDSAPGLIIAHGTADRTLSDDPDLYISRDGGVTWEETLAGSWGVNVADHGGLLVAARDYHQEQSSELMYSCNEGFTWSTFEFSTTTTTIFGVITEPGQRTTVMSLYGVASGQTQWRIFTVNFETIFDRVCVDGDYIQWTPRDPRSGTNCILGSTVTIERRNPPTCCLNGREYDREISLVICDCSGEDFECDYGYERENLTGACVRDMSVRLPDPCTEGKPNYTVSSGYRKIAGDVCEGGDEYIYARFTAPCCGNSTLPSNFPPATIPTNCGDHPNSSSAPFPSPSPSTSPSPSSSSSPSASSSPSLFASPLPSSSPSPLPSPSLSPSLSPSPSPLPSPSPSPSTSPSLSPSPLPSPSPFFLPSPSPSPSPTPSPSPSPSLSSSPFPSSSPFSSPAPSPSSSPAPSHSLSSSFSSPSSSPCSGPNTCEQTRFDSSSKSGPLIGTGVVIAILASACCGILIALVIVTLKYRSLRKSYLRLITVREGKAQTIPLISDQDCSLEPLTWGEESALDSKDSAPLLP